MNMVSEFIFLKLEQLLTAFEIDMKRAGSTVQTIPFRYKAMFKLNNAEEELRILPSKNVWKDSDDRTS